MNFIILKKDISLYLVFFLLIFLSSFARKYIPFAESNTWGALSGIFIMFFLYFKGLLNLKIKKLFLIVLTGVIAYSSIVIFINMSFNPNLNISRYIFSLFILIFFLIGAVLFSSILEKVNDKMFDKIINSVFLVLLSDGLISMFIQIFKDDKDFILFREPSHFAIVVLPILLYKVTTSTNRHAMLFIFLFLCIGLVMKSMTLIAGLALIAFMIFRIKNLVFIFALLVLTAENIPDLDFSYYKDRIDVSNVNPTLFVFLSGYEEAYLNVINTGAIGIGFQQLGFSKHLGKYRKALSDYGLPNINIYDGGFLGGKLVSEMGVVGFFMILVYLYKFITIKFFVNFSPDPCKKNKKMFFHSFYIMFVFELLFKGSGYFTQTTFLFFVVLLSLLTIDSSSRWKNDAYNHEAH